MLVVMEPGGPPGVGSTHIVGIGAASFQRTTSLTFGEQFRGVDEQ